LVCALLTVIDVANLLLGRQLCLDHFADPASGWPLLVCTVQGLFGCIDALYARDGRVFVLVPVEGGGRSGRVQV